MVNAAIREEEEEDDEVENEQGEGVLVVVVLVLVVNAKAAGTAGEAAAVGAGAEGGGIFSALTVALLLASPFQINPPEESEREVDGFSSFWKYE